MAIDSQAKRMSATIFFDPAHLASGTISRPAALNCYSGISISAPPTTLIDIDPDSDPLNAVMH